MLNVSLKIAKKRPKHIDVFTTHHISLYLNISAVMGMCMYIYMVHIKVSITLLGFVAYGFRNHDIVVVNVRT